MGGPVLVLVGGPPKYKTSHDEKCAVLVSGLNLTCHRALSWPQRSGEQTGPGSAGPRLVVRR